MNPLFLSYNSIDRSSDVAVQKLLEARGITTFLARDQLGPGSSLAPGAGGRAGRCARGVDSDLETLEWDLACAAPPLSCLRYNVDLQPAAIGILLGDEANVLALENLSVTDPPENRQVLRRLRIVQDSAIAKLIIFNYVRPYTSHEQIQTSPIHSSL